MVDLKLSDNISGLPFLFYYQGYYAEGPTQFIIGILENNIRRLTEKGQFKKIHFTLIEALQNIERYSSNVDSKEDFALVFRDNSFYYVVAQNLVRKDVVGTLKVRLDNLKDRNAHELSEEYIRQLASGEATERGAGLGLIEIVRKTKNRLQYDFFESDSQNSIYRLTFALPCDKAGEDKNPDFDLANKLCSAIRSDFSSNRSTLLYKGDFSNEFLKSLLEMLSVIKRDTKNIDKRTHHILIELIQNINKHGVRKDGQNDGIILIEWYDMWLKITTKNSINPEGMNKFVSKAEFLNASDKERLQHYSLNQLTDSGEISGMGLIDIANLIYPERIFFEIEENNQGLHQLSLQVKINHG